MEFFGTGGSLAGVASSVSPDVATTPPLTPRRISILLAPARERAEEKDCAKAEPCVYVGGGVGFDMNEECHPRLLEGSAKSSQREKSVAVRETFYGVLSLPTLSWVVGFLARNCRP